MPVAHRFERCTLLPDERQLLIDGAPAKIGARAFDLLLALIERRERTVTRNELFDLVWAGRVVEDHNLQVQVLTLRKLLGPKAIATIPGRGYRFVLPLASAASAAAGADATPAPAPAPTPAASAVPRGSPAAALSNLPAEPPTLHGRVADIAAVCRLLAEQRLVTLTGAGGIGKTRLAQAVAHQMRPRFADGVWIVELAPLGDDLELVCCTAMKSLGLPLANEACTAEGVARALSSLDLLLVLDNCEHVMAAAAALAEALLKVAPRLRLLATSQEPLHLGGEQVYRLGPLALPPSAAEQAMAYGAVSLFVERARAADRHFALSDRNLPAVVEICRRLDGIPLAIELASARVPVLGVDGVRQRIDERFRLLTGGARDAPARHRTLHNTLAWSHSLLDAPAQAVFRRLGVFAGSFSLTAAQQTAADASIDEWAVIDHLGVLVDKSLVTVEGDGEPRYRLLESARAFALEALESPAARGDALATRRRHARAMLELFARSDDDWLEQPTLDWLARLTPDLDNAREAFGFSTSADGEPAVAIALAAACATFASASGRGREGYRALVRVWPLLPEHATPHWLARVWLAVAQLGTMRAVLPPEARHGAQQAADGFRVLGDAPREYRALHLLATYADEGGEGEGLTSAAVDAQMRQLEASAGAAWPPGLKRLGRMSAARQWRRQGLVAEYRDAFADDARRCAEAGDPHRAWLSFHHVALAELSLGRIDAAAAIMRGVADEVRQRGLQREMWQQMAMNALVAIEQGDPAAALPAVREALDLLRVQGAVWWLADHLAWLAAQRGDISGAARLHGWADAQAVSRAAQRGPVMQRARDRLAERLAAALAVDELTRLRNEGATLRDDEVLAVALAAPR